MANRLFMMLMVVASLGFLAAPVTAGGSAVLVLYNGEAKDTLLGKKCMEQETMDLRRAMYKSVGYKIDDNRRRLNTGGVTNFCIDWCNGYEVDNCQIVHPECGTASAAGPQVVAYIGDDSQCEDEILKIDQALDLVADAMEADCQELVSTRSFKCIISK